MHSATAQSRPDDKVAAASHRRRRYRPALERCEARALLTTYTVTALTDGGAGGGTAGDLRYCLSRADADGQRDTIDFAVTGTIQLGSPLPELVNARGITIAGPGAGVLTIRGGGAADQFTMLRVQVGATAAISGLTIADGFAPRSGGGIFNQGKLTIADATFSGDSALVDGGAINNDGTVTITGSTFVGNTAGQSGGAVYGLGPTTITNSIVDGNSAVASGGGVETATGALAITGTTIDNNSTDFYGGGISVNGPRDPDLTRAALTLDDSTLSGNTAGRPTGGGFGGGISSFDAQVTIRGSSLTGNSAGRDAGGLGINGGDVSVNGSTFSGNATSGNGGGIFTNGGHSVNGLNVTDGAALAVANSTFTGNTADGNGGGLAAVLTTVKVAGSTFAGNEAGAFGGGIALDGNTTFTVTRGSLSLANSTLSGNTAGRSGGGLSSFDHLILSHVTISGNLATLSGGGIITGRSLTLGRSSITENTPDNVATT